MHSSKLAITVSFMSLAFAATTFAAPATFTTDPDHTFVRFSYNHEGFTTQVSRFNKVSGKVTYDAAAKTGSLDIVVDTKSIDTGSDEFNKEIQTAEFLDTAKFPTATFKSTAVKFNGDKPASVQGNLTVKGITKPVTLTVKSFTRKPNYYKKDAIGADATGTIKRSDFNMGSYAPAVSDELTLEIAIEAALP